MRTPFCKKHDENDSFAELIECNDCEIYLPSKLTRGHTLYMKDPNGQLKLDLRKWRIVRFEIEPIRGSTSPANHS